MISVDLSGYILVFSLVSTILSVWNFFKTDKQRTKKEIAQEAKKEMAFESDISVIRQGNAAIMVQLDKVDIKMDKADTKMDTYHERLTRVEESAKQAHKRIDDLGVKK